MLLPRGYIALGCKKRNHLLVRYYKITKLCGNAAGDNGQYIPLEGSTAKNPWACKTMDFWPWDLPRGYIHYYISLAFPHDIPFS